LEEGDEYMVDPPIGSLLGKVDNRFILCILTGKRARQLIDGAHKLTGCTSGNPITIAINEINENMITYVMTKSGIK
jgi:DNA-directed RNA polymerase subunit omega